MKKVSENKNLKAYIIGLALGDGNLSNPNGRAVKLRISCTTQYPNLLSNISLSIQKLLPQNKVSILQRHKNYADVYCYSNYWESILGWRADKGSKFIQRVRVPLWVMSNYDFIIQCLKGLIETDGSVYKDRGYSMVMFVTIIPELAMDVINMFRILGYHPRAYLIKKASKKFNYNSQPVFHIRLSKDVEKFLQLVQPLKS